MGGGASGIAGGGFPPHGSPRHLKDLMEMDLGCLFLFVYFLRTCYTFGYAKAIYIYIIIFLVFSDF